MPFPKDMLLGSNPFIIFTHHQPGWMGHDSDNWTNNNVYTTESPASSKSSSVAHNTLNGTVSPSLVPSSGLGDEATCHREHGVASDAHCISYIHRSTQRCLAGILYSYTIKITANNGPLHIKLSSKDVR